MIFFSKKEKKVEPAKGKFGDVKLYDYVEEHVSGNRGVVVAIVDRLGELQDVQISPVNSGELYTYGIGRVRTVSPRPTLPTTQATGVKPKVGDPVLYLPTGASGVVVARILRAPDHESLLIEGRSGEFLASMDNCQRLSKTSVEA